MTDKTEPNMGRSPILDNKLPDEPSVFVPHALLREARRQKGLAAISVPDVCILDPDGDMVRRLRSTGQATRFEGWACYHTELDVFTLGGREVGILDRAVGASFAVGVSALRLRPRDARARPVSRSCDKHDGPERKRFRKRRRGRRDRRARRAILACRLSAAAAEQPVAHLSAEKTSSADVMQDRIIKSVARVYLTLFAK